MNYFLENWGSFVGLLGLLVGIAGVVFSVAAFQRAGKARDAAEAAKQATSIAISRSLATVDLERAIALTQRLKELHRVQRWEASLEHYQPLRVFLAEIRSRHPGLSPELQDRLREAIVDIREMEDLVSTVVQGVSELGETQAMDQILNQIQTELEGIASQIQSEEHYKGE